MCTYISAGQGIWGHHSPKEWPAHCVCLKTLPQRRDLSHTRMLAPFFSRTLQSLSAFGRQCRHQCHAGAPEIYHPGQPQHSFADSASGGWVGGGLAHSARGVSNIKIDRHPVPNCFFFNLRVFIKE